MLRLPLVLVALTFVAGCAGTTLPYKPEQQPSGARISAAYQIVGERLRIEIDTNQRRLEEAKIVKPDGTELRALAIETAPTVTSSSPSPVGVGIGIGGGTFGGRGGVGVGTGVSVGIPVGGTTTTVEGNTFASFPLDQAGPPPWRLHVRLAGVEPAVILVGAAPSGPR